MTSEAPDDPVPDERGVPVDGPGYAEAVVELEAILAELEEDDVDVDVLAERVGRASELVRVCRLRIDAARFQVERIVAELGEPASPVGVGASPASDDEDPIPDDGVVPDYDEPDVDGVGA
jgi:exodeoxyribonuclease VII small subunit